MIGKLVSLFSAKPRAPKAAGAQLAMPLFSSVDPIDPDAVVRAWASLFGDQPALRVSDGQGSGDAVVYEAGGVVLMTMHVPMAIPNDEALHAVKSSWMWQQPDTPVRTHAAHAIVTTPPAGDPVLAAWNVSRLCAALLTAGSGAALYWGNGRQVHAPAVVAEFAQSTVTPPVPLWVGVTISGESAAGPFSATTDGLEAFGHKEFEVRGTRMTIGDLRSTLLDLALYVLRKGPVLLDGQTFGPSADVTWTIRHQASKLVPGRAAIVLGIP